MDRSTAAFLFSITAASPALAQIESDFVSSDGGWVCVSDDAQQRSPSFFATGGDPGGFINRADFGAGSWFFVAPDAYTGDLSRFAGGSLSFSLRSVGSAAPSVETDDILIEGPGGRLVLDIPPSGNPGPDWSRYTVALGDTEDWRYTGPLDGQPLDAQFAGVLAEVTALSIRGDWREGADTGSLDSVRLREACVADLADPLGVLDLADIGAFIDAFANQQPAADLAAPDGVFDLADIGAFIAAFQNGCP